MNKLLNNKSPIRKKLTKKDSMYFRPSEVESKIIDGLIKKVGDARLTRTWQKRIYTRSILYLVILLGLVCMEFLDQDQLMTWI